MNRKLMSEGFENFLDRHWLSHRIKCIVLHVIYSNNFLYDLLFPDPPTLDDFTSEIRNLRMVIDQRRHVPGFADKIPEWDHELNIFEWEHVRRLERAGFPNHPFIIEKKRRSLPPEQWHELEAPL